MAKAVVPQAERIHVHLDPEPVLAAFSRHRRRFAEEVSALDAAALATQSRCSKWSVADVLRHGCDVDEWMRALWSGGAPPFTSFDPNVTPHEYVVASRSICDAEIRDRYVASSETVAADLDASDASRWALPSISPVGAVPWWLSAMHVFYDSWMHERDVLLPLGLATPNDSDEVIPVLAYSLALAGTFVTKPREIDVAGVHLTAGVVPVSTTPLSSEADERAPIAIDAINGRASFEVVFEGADPSLVHDLGGLARFFLSTV